MPRQLLATPERFRLREAFTIARGSKTEAHVVTCRVSEAVGGRVVTGWGECVPYPRYNESVEGVLAQIEGVRARIEAGATRETLPALLSPGAARNAVDCALWDLEAKTRGGGGGVAAYVCKGEPAALETAFTLSLGEAGAMERDARLNRERPLLKIKLGRPGDIERLEAVRRGAPDSRLIVDANEGWGADALAENMKAAARLGVALVEQPLPAGADAGLAGVPHPVPVCADESVHGLEDLVRLRPLYEAVNIKLDKTGGLTAALALKAEAERLGFAVMVGCMVGTSLAMAPAVLLAQGADFVDLDGPLLLAEDRAPALRYEGSRVHPPERALWG